MIALLLTLKFNNNKCYYMIKDHNPHNVLKFNNILLNILHKYNIKEFKGNISDFKIKREKMSLIYEKDLFNDSNNKIFLKSYFQSYLYFKKYKQIIIDIFTKNLFSNILKNKILKKYTNIDWKKNIFIHIRGGDFLKSKHHKVDLKKYYLKSIKYFLKKNINYTFLIFTNDKCYKNKIINYLKKNIKFNHKCINENELESLYIMSICNGCIVANSSFSWWGGYLNKNHNKILMPSNWLNYDIYYKDIYFSNAKIIDVK